MDLYTFTAPTVIDPNGFDPLPPQLYIIVVCLVILFFVRRFGKRITPESGKWFDAFIDVLSLIAASGATLAFASTPLGNNSVTALSSWVIPDKNSSVAFSGTQIGVGVILLIILVLIAISYIKTESGFWLTLFALTLYIASGLNSPIRVALEWVVDPGLQSINNQIVGFTSSMLNAQPFKN